jgi:putative flippase GtrA
MLAENRSRTMQQHANALNFAIVGAVGTSVVALLTFLAVQFVTLRAEATPVIAQGKACNTCHTSSAPSKEDLKK